ncbi:uncharacterized protein DMAD_10424 [Drosophila madeirensis]|uniref:Secreted protein n=1 Tax=Drosophila madeirensis TaxID=30013 RepID=A0AAU9F9I0_DROMD
MFDDFAPLWPLVTCIVFVLRILYAVFCVVFRIVHCVCIPTVTGIVSTGIRIRLSEPQQQERRSTTKAEFNCVEP